MLQLLGTEFVSDMEDVHNFAADINAGHPFANLSQYPNIPRATHLNMTALVLSFVYRIFGVSTITAKLFMVVLSALTTLFIYFAGRMIATPRVGLTAAFIFAALPSLLCYTSVLVGDHIALPLMVLAILVFAHTIEKDDDKKSLHQILWYALCGGLVGLADWFRPIGIALLVALVISVVIYQLRGRFFNTLAILVVMIAGYLLVSSQAVAISERFFHTKIVPASQLVGGYLLVGLNPESHGGVNLDDAKIIGETYARYEGDYKGARAYLVKLAFSRLEQEQVIPLLKDKFTLMWASHDALFDYPLIGSDDHDFVNLLRDIETVVYLVISVFILVNILLSIQIRSRPAVFSMQLFMLGFALLLIVLEVQNRYVIVVIPYSILLCVMGLESALSMLETRLTSK
jgi:4-amino-4-deoxy-L-arabinose transferase-like glycosyltransferase